MAKITRKYNATFGDTGPTGVLGQWGSYKGGTGVYSNDPDTLQALSGFAAGIAGGQVNNAPPTIEEVNGLLYLLSRQIGYSLQTSIPEWNAGTEYHTGSFVSVATDGAIYVSVAASNTNNAVSDTTKWKLYHSHKITPIEFNNSTNFGLYLAVYDDITIVTTTFTDAAGGVINLPAPAATNKGRKITVVNMVPDANGSTQIGYNGSTTGLIDGKSGQVSYTMSKKGDHIVLVSNGTYWMITDQNGAIDLF